MLVPRRATGRRPPSPRAVLVSASAAQAAVSFLTFGLPAIGPQLRADLHLSLPALGAVLSANLFGAGLGLIPSGFAVDRFGSKRATLAGIALGVAGLVAAAFADSTPQLLAALLASGIGLSVVPIAGAGALFRAYGPERRAWALGVRQMSAPVGGMIASVLLPGLEALGGARLALLVGAGAVAVAGAVFAPLSGDAPLRGRRPGVAFARILRSPGMPRLLLVAGLYVVVLQTVLTYAVPAARAAGLSAFDASATFFVLNVTAAVARLAWGRIADRGGGTRRTRTLVDAGWVAGAGALLFAAALHGGVAAVLPAAIVFGFGALGWNALVYVSAGERLPPELAGQSVAVAATVVFLLSAASTPPLGALAAHAGWDAFWIVSGCLALAGSLIATRLPRAAHGVHYGPHPDEPEASG